MSTGPVPVFDCIPDLASFFPSEPGIDEVVQGIKCCPPNGNQLYSLGYASYQVGSFLLNGAFNEAFGLTGQVALNDAVSRAENWFGRLAVFLVLPWLLIFLALFIYLGITGVMSGFAAIIFITITLLLAGFCLFVIIWDARNTILRLREDVNITIRTGFSTVRNTVAERWNNNELVLVDRLFESYTLQKSCNPDEDIVCCGYEGCANGCAVPFVVDPNTVPTSATGTLSFILDPPTGATGGFLIIPPELNGGTGTTIPFDTNGPQDFTYTTTAQQDAVDIIAVIYGLGEPFSLTNKVFIIDMTGLTGATSGFADDQSTLFESDTPFREETKLSMEQLHKTLQDAQHLQESLQQRLARPRKQQELQKKGSCKRCPKRSIRASICPNGNCQ